MQLAEQYFSKYRSKSSLDTSYKQTYIDHQLAVSIAEEAASDRLLRVKRLKTQQ
jgi:hypothetical protein